MAAKITPPSITETAFDCPYCGAFTTQYWLHLYPEYFNDKVRTPSIPNAEVTEQIRAIKQMDAEKKAKLIDWVEKMNSGLIFVVGGEETHYLYSTVNNLFLN